MLFHHASCSSVSGAENSPPAVSPSACRRRLCRLHRRHAHELGAFDHFHGVERFATDDDARLRFAEEQRVQARGASVRARVFFLSLGSHEDARHGERSIVAPISAAFRGR
jgi:hypothetical protein